MKDKCSRYLLTYISNKPVVVIVPLIFNFCTSKKTATVLGYLVVDSSHVLRQIWVVDFTSKYDRNRPFFLITSKIMQF